MSDAALIEDLVSFTNDPLGFALWAFPWGEPGSPLEHRRLEAWQVTLLKQLGEGVLTPAEAIRIARVSGNGVGKSAIVSIIILWAVSTFEDTKGVVTANTETQLFEARRIPSAQIGFQAAEGGFGGLSATAHFAQADQTIIGLDFNDAANEAPPMAAVGVAQRRFQRDAHRGGESGGGPAGHES